MRIVIRLLFLGIILSGCADRPGLAWPWARDDGARGVETAPQSLSSPVNPERRDGRLTPEGFDMTSTAERRAATGARGGVLIGRTVASLGAPQEQGFWLRTGLVTAQRAGRVRVPETGTSVKVTLRPSGGSASAGSQMSLAAFRALGLPLTGLPRVEVYAGG